MKKLALALVAAATLGLALPVFSAGAEAATTVTRTKTVKTGHGPAVKKVVVRRGHGWHGRRHVATRKVVVKRRANGTVVRKTVVRRHANH